MKLDPALSHKSLKLRLNLLWIGAFTLATILVWGGYSLYSVYSQSTIDPEVEELLTPFDPSINQEALQALNDRFEPPTDFTVTTQTQDEGESISQPIDLPESQGFTATGSSFPAPPAGTASGSLNSTP